MCQTPELQVFDGSVVPSSAPARCVHCGQVLYLACGPDSPPPVNAHSVARQRAKYAPKPCARCLRTFEPKGPNSLYCSRDDCNAIAAAHPAPSSPSSRA